MGVAKIFDPAYFLILGHAYQKFQKISVLNVVLTRSTHK